MYKIMHSEYRLYNYNYIIIICSDIFIDLRRSIEHKYHVDAIINVNINIFGNME